MAQGRLRWLVTRGRVKWVGVVLSILILVSFVSSLFMRVHAIRAIAKSESYVRVDLMAGGVQVFWFEYSRGRHGALLPDVWEWDIEAERGWMLWRPPDVYPGLGLVFVPLWLPLLFIAAPTAYLWYTDRRAKPWQCQKCRYDLRGLDGGVCPECGNPAEHKA